MRREGRLSGWVRAYDIDLVDPEGKQRRPSMAHAALPGMATVANGGFVMAPRKPTNHSKSTGLYRQLGGKGAGSSASGKGRQKFRHDNMKMHYLEIADAVDRRWDVLPNEEK